jgi:predicted AlkP superfamily phosphohydrolase/phosphomutase
MGLFPTLGWAEDATGLNAGYLDEDGFLEQAYYMLGEQEKLTFWALEAESPDLLISVTEVTDRIAHVFMGRDRGDERSGAVLECYQRFDAFVGRVVTAVGPDATVIVLSDHGFAPMHHIVHLNSWLRDSGYLVLHESENRSPRKRPFWPDVDWRRTRAYALGLSHIYVNLRGRERLGCVEPGGEYTRLCREIAARLSQLRDPGSGESVVSRVMLRDQLYSGPCIDRSGDLVVAFRRGYRTSEQTAVGGVPAQVVVPNRRRAWSADHCSVDPDEVPGVLFCNRPLNFAGAGLIDIAPTVLDLLGVTEPKGLEGRSLVP